MDSLSFDCEHCGLVLSIALVEIPDEAIAVMSLFPDVLQFVLP